MSYITYGLGSKSGTRHVTYGLGAVSVGPEPDPAERTGGQGFIILRPSIGIVDAAIVSSPTSAVDFAVTSTIDTLDLVMSRPGLHSYRAAPCVISVPDRVEQPSGISRHQIQASIDQTQEMRDVCGRSTYSSKPSYIDSDLSEDDLLALSLIGLDSSGCNSREDMELCLSGGAFFS